jgi:hypothetical protein
MCQQQTIALVICTEKKNKKAFVGNSSKDKMGRIQDEL